ncbi:MAG: ammonium transporter [bacterium]|nr:ammonium transporter [bacterium]
MRTTQRVAATLGLATAFLLLSADAGWTQEAKELTKAVADMRVALDTVWVMVAGFLVFWMHAGFAMLESGLCRAKNTVAILYKNFGVVAVSSLAFWVIGFALMFGDGNAFTGMHGLFLAGADNSPLMGSAYKGVFASLNWTGIPLYAKFFFQLVFAATAATIVSGCVAERIHFSSFMIFSFLLVAILYPIQGHWIWGGGWLGSWGFLDFAGSTVVHSVGGWAGLAGIIVLGPRLGKYDAQGRMTPIPGHNMALVTLGGFILWLGWFGFNPGSTMAADPGAIARIAVTTNLAAAAGVITSSIFSRMFFGKADLSMSVNGALAGLVAITAPCAFVTPAVSVLIGAIAGTLVCLSVPFFDRVRIDDPVGAISVHLVCGVFGTIALGLWGNPGLTGGAAGLFYGGGTGFLFKQIVGVAAVGAFTFVLSLILWYIVRAIVGIRVSPENEYTGLDLAEHGMEAYPKS